jgi:Zn-dependent protease
MFGLSGNLVTIVFSIVALVLAIDIHEFSHALAADRLGDPTPRLQGRLTLNPLAHLDPIGTIMLLLVHFGWGKPVQFDPYNLRHPRRDSAIISLAGPFSNFLFASISALVIHILFTLRLPMLTNTITGTVSYILIPLLESCIILNVMLGVFNLVPIHPLDGFKIVEGILPDEYARQWHDLEPYGMLFLLFLILPIFGGNSAISNVISPIVNFVVSLLLPGGQFI